MSELEKIHARIDLAKEQLDIAIELFIGGRSYVSVLTLAGAAEEILGKALSHRNEKTTLQDMHSIVRPIEELFQGKPYAWKEFVERKNRVRNAAKHMKADTESTITADLEEEAMQMVMRAYDNHMRLGLEPSPQMQEFDKWFYTYVVGLEYEV